MAGTILGMGTGFKLGSPMSQATQAVIQAALDLCTTIAPLRESLRHPKHAAVLDPLHKRAKQLMAEFFLFQGRDIIAHSSRAIHIILEHMKEAKTEEDKRADPLVRIWLGILGYAPDRAESTQWDGIIWDGVSGGALTLANDLEVTLPNTEPYVVRYLKEHSLAKLSGELASETVKQLRTAVAESIAAGADFGQVVNAIQATFAGFSDSRSEMIAQTELNSAYNAGRNALASSMGLDEKSWATESNNPCPTCLDNEAEGWIPIGQEFGSGVQFPAAHPRCFCSVDFR